MRKTAVKMIMMITAFSMAIAFCIGSFAMNKSMAYLTAEINEKILYTAEKFSNEFSVKFNHMEGLTDALFSYVETSFDVEGYKSNPEMYMEKYEKELSDFIENNIHTVRNAHSLYVTFNPDLTEEQHEVWFAEMDGSVRQIFVDFEKSNRDFEEPYEKDMAYFFKPQGKKDGVWIEPYYDKDIDEDVFSYSRAIYIDDFFVGVAGADITADDTVEVVEQMKLYKNGTSDLLNEDYEFIIQPESISDGEKKIIKECLQKGEGKQQDRDSGITTYDYKGSIKILGYSMMDNGWTMVISSPEEEAYKPIKSLKIIFVVLAAILGAVLVAFLIAFLKPLIKKQSDLEEENREKNILLIYQSRQAKIGEMVGNITHQWKQPLNTINLIMANLLDSYRYNELDEERLKKSVDKVEGIVGKMSETITDFSQFLKPTKKKRLFSVEEAVKSALFLMEEGINLNRLKVKINCTAVRKAYGYYNEAVHVIFNVLNNAEEAIVLSDPEDKTISIDIKDAGDMVEVTITNHGERIPERIMEHIFEPYITTKENTGGTGLGLYISRQIIEGRIGGKLEIENLEDGVKCYIFMPAEPQKENDDEHG